MSQNVLNISQGKAKNYQSQESYKTIRTNIEFSGDDIHMIAVTSSLPNEGKSQVSLNLAIAFAEMNAKVLFVDLDLRKSVMAGRYKISKKIMGVTHYLTGKATLEEAIQSTDVNGLDVMYAGAFPPDPTQLLVSQNFKNLINEVRDRYDYVIMDTPPLGSVIDCAVIAPLVDGVVLLIAANEISYHLAQDVKNQLEKTGCHILGVVLNKVDMSRNSYYNKYHYGGRYGRYYRRYYRRSYKAKPYGGYGYGAYGSRYGQGSAAPGKYSSTAKVKEEKTKEGKTPKQQ